jgi:hypothetical protein
MRNHVFKEIKLELSLFLLQPYCISHALPSYGLRVKLKCTHGFMYQIWNFPIPSHTFRCFMFVSSKYVYETLFPWVDHGILDQKIHLSKVFPLFISTIGMKILKEEFNLSWCNISISSTQKIMVSSWRSLKTVKTPSLFSYLGISGSRFLQGG